MLKTKVNAIIRANVIIPKIELWTIEFEKYLWAMSLLRGISRIIMPAYPGTTTTVNRLTNAKAKEYIPKSSCESCLAATMTSATENRMKKISTATRKREFLVTLL